jgi:hypothetical protein
MPLGDLQTALGMLVAARVSPHGSGAGVAARLDRLDLTAEERGWLDLLADSPGFKITCGVARWWRKTRLLWGAPLTVAALGDRADPVAEEYLDRTPCSTLFFAPEALGFLDFVLAAELTAPHLDAVARFERALIRAVEVQAMSLPPLAPDAGGIRRPARVGARGPADPLSGPAPTGRELSRYRLARVAPAVAPRPARGNARPHRRSAPRHLSRSRTRAGNSGVKVLLIPTIRTSHRTGSYDLTESYRKIC